MLEREPLRAGRTHPGEQELERFMRGELPRRELHAVVRHLLTGCPQCVQVTRRLWEFGDRATPAGKRGQRGLRI